MPRSQRRGQMDIIGVPHAGPPTSTPCCKVTANKKGFRPAAPAKPKQNCHSLVPSVHFGNVEKKGYRVRQRCKQGMVSKKAPPDRYGCPISQRP